MVMSHVTVMCFDPGTQFKVHQWRTIQCTIYMCYNSYGQVQV